MLIAEALFITIVYLCDLLLVVPKYTRCKYDHTPRKNKLLFKGLAIGLPLFIFLYGMIKNTVLKTAEPYEWLLFVGMLFCAVGDIILEIRFVYGGMLFFMGHVFYVISLIKSSEYLSFVSLAIYILIAGIGTYLTCKKLSKKYRFYLIIYNLVISASLALAVPLVYKIDSPYIAISALGICLLVASDWLLARNRAYGSTYSWSLISLLLYFGGQILISAYPMLK